MNGRFLLDDSWSVDSADFPQSGTPRDKLAFLLNYAVLAPSILGTAIEPARTQQRRIQDLRAIGGGEQHKAAAGIEAIQLRQQLVERLFLLVMAARERECAARPTQGVQFVDEDDGRSGGAGLLEKVAHARGPDADEHLDELRTADGKEWNPRFAGYAARQQGFARARRSDKQDVRQGARSAWDLSGN